MAGLSPGSLHPGMWGPLASLTRGRKVMCHLQSTKGGFIKKSVKTVHGDPGVGQTFQAANSGLMSDVDGRGRVQYEGRRGLSDWILESDILSSESDFIAYCVILEEVLNLSVSELTNLSNEDNNHRYFMVVVRITWLTDVLTT